MTRYCRKGRNGASCVLLFGVFLTGVLMPSVARSEEPATRDELETAISRATLFLQKCVLENGRFLYELDMEPDRYVPLRYNILRHAGTIYAMSAAHRYRPDESLKTALLKATAYLKREAMAPIPGQQNMAGIWSLPEMDFSGGPPEVKLGGAGLGLVALVSAESIAPGTTSLDELRSIARFLLYMQNVDGSFATSFVPSRGGKSDHWESLYYPGEAALALVMLHELDPASGWAIIALRALLYLARERAALEEVPNDHWALIATAQLLKIAPEVVSEGNREELLRHAMQVCDAFLAIRASSARTNRYFGGFIDEGRTSPTSTSIEGLVAILPFLPRDDSRYRAVREAVDSGITFLLTAQVKSGLYEGAVPHATAHLPDGAASEVDDGMGRTHVRIDYVQHALSAWLEYHALLEAESAPAATGNE